MVPSSSAPRPDPQLCRADESGQVVYLDHNATTPVHPEVAELIAAWLRDGWGNPSSAHARGREAKAALHWAREGVAQLIAAPPESIIFTGCGTESNHLAILGAAQAHGGRGRLLYGDLEHPSVIAPMERLESQGWQRQHLATGQTGQVELPAASERAENTDLAALMLAHNETGALQPVADFARALHGDNGDCFVHCDASQAVGKVPVDVAQLDVDTLTIAGHKLYAPKGIGALYLRPGRSLAPWLAGGGQEGGLRSGTESVPYIVGLGMAARLAHADVLQESARIFELREQLWAKLVQAIPGAWRVSPKAPHSLPNTLLVCLPQVSGAALLAACPGVAASTGSACHEGADHSGSFNLLSQMAVPAELQPGVLRLSLGRDSTEAAIERAVTELASAHRQLKEASGV